MSPKAVNRNIIIILTSCLVFLAFQNGHVGAFQSHLATRRSGVRNVIRSATHKRPTPNHDRFSNSNIPLRMREWDGDDIRWTSRLRRKLSRRRLLLDLSDRSPTKTALIGLQILLYMYQIVTTITMVRRKFPSYWPEHAMEMIVDSIWGSAVVNGPLTNTFGFSAAFRKVPHRYLTSGLFHSGLPHLLVNLGVMSNQASWLATGLGGPLYGTTFLGSIIAGNMAHALNSPDKLFDVGMVLGSSAGIAGLFGLMFVSVTRIARVNPTNGGASSGQIFRGMAILIGLGLWMDNVSVAMTIGGFFGGILVAILCGPRYDTDYAMRRKNSAGYDPQNVDYRRVMGFGIMPTRGRIPLNILWTALLCIAMSNPGVRSAPLAIVRGLQNAQ